MANFKIRLLPKGKTLGNGLFSIAPQIEWYKLHSCSEVTVLCLQRFKAAKILAYTFGVLFLIITYGFKG